MIWAVRPFCMGLNIALCGWGGGLRYEKAGVIPLPVLTAI